MQRSLLRAFVCTCSLFVLLGVSAQGRAMEVIFKPDMDKAALDKIQEDAKANGLELDYTRTEFKDGRLSSIGFVLKTKKGMGSAEIDGLGDDDTFGFNYLPKARGGEAAFSVGTLKELGTKEPGPDR